MQIKINKELAVGLVFTITSLLFLYFGRIYSVGDPINMGPGFLPFFLSLMLLALGIIQFGRAWKNRAAVDIDLVGPLVVATTIAVFAYLLPWIGAVVGTGVVMLIVGRLHPKFSLKGWAISYAVVIALILVFKFLLGSTIPLWIR